MQSTTDSRAVGSTSPTFSFVIPTYNEECDIAPTVSAALDQRYPALEVIVVDGASTDATCEILGPWTAAGTVRLIRQPRRMGVAAARNEGIDAARGDVVVVLNADVRPRPDFLARLVPHYDAGYDCVSVESSVVNLERAIPRFLEADHRVKFGGNARGNVGWTEGFSCRRSAATAVRFPASLPGLGGEDVEFFNGLLAAGAAWKGDFSIVVPHQAPATLPSFWQQWQARGSAVPYIEARLRRRSLPTVTLRRLLATGWSTAKGALLVPGIVAAWRRARVSPAGRRDLASFLALVYVQMVAHRVGEWRALARLWRAQT